MIRSRDEIAKRHTRAAAARSKRMKSLALVASYNEYQLELSGLQKEVDDFMASMKRLTRKLTKLGFNPLEVRTRQSTALESAPPSGLKKRKSRATLRAVGN